MKPTELQSDAFKFYARRLRELGYVEKDGDGNYTLTAKGKEFANNLDEETARQVLPVLLSLARQRGWW